MLPNGRINTQIQSQGPHASTDGPPPQPLPRPIQTQPKSFKLSVKAFLSLPYRICHPPTATVGSVRSFSVTPIYEVKLDDILNRKHLPPLGLKDFEEWLLYVENVPENLYFILWLRDYTQRYHCWTHQSRPVRDKCGEYRVAWPTQTSSQLALFYARAKQTFFTTNSAFELNLPSDILAPFHTSNCIHPDPAVFTEVANEVRKMLEESLARFVISAYTNVGTGRAVCGLVGGTVISLLGSVPPLVCNFVNHESRWLRLAAMPGLWLGLTVLLSSLHGVCLMIWAGGDIRQLRKFELSRPPISKPTRPLHNTQRSIPDPVQPFMIPKPPPIPRLYIPPPPLAHLPNPVSRPPSTTPSTTSYSPSTASSNSDSPSDISGHEIYISPAYYDEDPIEGPATCHDTPVTSFSFPQKPFDSIPSNAAAGSSSPSFTPTAAFIPPFVYDDTDEKEEYVDDILPTSLRRATHDRDSNVELPFDFDTLPPRRPAPLILPSPRSTAAPPVLPPEHHPRSKSESVSRTQTIVIQRDSSGSLLLQCSSFSEFFGYLQDWCSFRKWRVAAVDGDPEKNSPSDADDSRPHHSNSSSHSRNQHLARVRAQFKLVKAVPSFASPLTRILSPVIRRAQWVIVSRSAVLSLLICWIFLGSLLAVPVHK